VSAVTPDPRSRLAASLLALLATACGGPAPPTAESPAVAGRIATLSPHLAELVYEAGAGAKLVGVAEYSDFPPEVASLPRIGDAFRIDEEALLALEPDLVLGWTSGNPAEAIARLRRLGFRVVTLEPTRLADVAGHIEAIGELAGTGVAAKAAAGRYRRTLAGLEARYAEAAPVSAFVQLAARPWYTVTDRHFLGQGLRLCGGNNVFGGLPGLTAVVSLEAIIAARPGIIIASDMGQPASAVLAEWAPWHDVPAVAGGHVETVDADLLSRPAGRVLDGIATLCAALDRVRGAAPTSG